MRFGHRVPDLRAAQGLHQHDRIAAGQIDERGALYFSNNLWIVGGTRIDRHSGLRLRAQLLEPVDAVARGHVGIFARRSRRYDDDSRICAARRHD